MITSLKSAGLVAILAVAMIAPALASGVEQTVQACVAEAKLKHGKFLLKQQSVTNNKYHVARMTERCEAWRNVAGTDRTELLKSCEAEARGMVRGMRAMVYYGDHVRALKGHCQALYTMTETRS
jgi:hypothetical protein